MKMLKFIQSITTAIKGASLTAKIIGVATAVVVAGGTTAVIVVQANSSVQEPQDTETNDNSDKDTEQEKNEDKEENKDQDENLDNSDNQENKTDEQQTTNNNQTTNSGTTKPSSSGNSSQSGNFSQQGTSQSTTQTQPATPKAEFNLNDSIQIMQFGYTCNKFLGGDYSDPSNYVSAPGGGWIEISATGRRFSKGSGTCPDGYDLNGGAVPRVLDEYWCNLYGLSCDRW